MTTHRDSNPEQDLSETRELLDRHAQGEAAAAEALYQRYARSLDRFLHARVPESARGLMDSRDIAQEVWTRAFHAMANFEYRGIGSFWAYLRRIGVCHLIDVARKEGRGGSLAGAEEVPEPESLERRPLSRLVQQEDLAVLEAALEELAERERDAVRLRIELDLDYRTIAEECDYLSEDAARMAIRRALSFVCGRVAGADGGA